MFYEEKIFTLKDESQISAYIRESNKDKWLVVTHGIGEHGLRHKHFFKHFSQHYNICLYDLRGHGSSSGERAHIDDFETYSRDLREVIDQLHGHYKMNDYVLFGHSMGGLVVADFMQNYVEKGFYPEKVFLSSPAVSPTGFLGNILYSLKSSWLQSIAEKSLSFKLGGLLDLNKLSHNDAIAHDYLNDSKNCLKSSVKLLLQTVSRSKTVFSKSLGITCPLYCIIGDDDHLVSFNKCHQFFTEVDTNCDLKVIEGGYHELHNEIKRYREPYYQFLRDSLI